MQDSVISSDIQEIMIETARERLNANRGENVMPRKKCNGMGQRIEGRILNTNYLCLVDTNPLLLKIFCLRICPVQFLLPLFLCRTPSLISYDLQGFLKIYPTKIEDFLATLV